MPSFQLVMITAGVLDMRVAFASSPQNSHPLCDERPRHDACSEALASYEPRLVRTRDR